MRSVLCLLSMAALTLVGCGGAEDRGNRLPVFPVSGSVSYKGRPVVGADITFISADKNKSAFGRTDEQGRFQLTTYAPNDGAVGGKHTVVVSKIPPTTTAAAGIEPEDPRYDPFAVEKSAPKVTAKSEFPPKYADPKKSDLIVVVTEDDANKDLKLELKD